MKYDRENRLFHLAADLVNQSSRNIYLTGKAGTGKTTFLKYIRENCSKQMVVVAPTGVAAINAGGVTMHSFFQLPFSPFLPGVGGAGEDIEDITTPGGLIGRLRMTTDKKKIIQELELLVIDEVSMVRCDMLDAIDAVLRHVRHRRNERFGGVQVVMIGDMWQLPPVVKEAEWRLLKEHYNSPYFFDSHVIKDEPPVFIEFEKIYRQNEKAFITLLNQVRNNQLDDEGQRLLEKLFQPSFRRSKGDGYIILTTHNEKAANTNFTELGNLDKEVFSYKAEIEGDFPESSFPAEELLQLKVGAQVMFIKNDSEKIRRYFNGKIGTVEELDNERISIRCNDESALIEVKKEKWENIRYSLNKATRQLEEEVLGSFVQYPLKLAWAITIHKSQGLTFEKAIIDAGDAFAPGQVYVALSRCTTLEGIVLKSRIRPGGLFTDEKIIRFSQNMLSTDLLEEEKERSKRKHQLKILCSLFDYSNEIRDLNELEKYLEEHKESFNTESQAWISSLLEKLATLRATAEKFHIQLQKLYEPEERTENITSLQERIKAGVTYFTKEQKKIEQFILQSPVITDSRNHAREFNDSLKEVFIRLSLKKHLLDGIGDRFDIDAYYSRKKNFSVPLFTVHAYAGVAKQKTDNPHSRLYQQLRKLRDDICSKKDLPIYIVAGSTTLDEMARFLPQTLSELRRISGFGDAKIEKYGQQFLNIILNYCKTNQLSSLIHEKTPKRERKEKSGEKKLDTKSETFNLYKNGKSIAEIAKERSLTTQTIEGHLSHYVRIGEIEIRKLVSEEKIILIEPHLKDFDGGSITSIKEKLGNGVSFGEIRLVIAWVAHKQSLST